jgi:dihydrofolate reductase
MGKIIVTQYVSLDGVIEDPVGMESWNNSNLITGNLIEATSSIKANAKGDILVYGSASIVHQLAPQGLIDEYRLMVFPIVLGRGIRLFPENHAQNLALVENEQFDDGITMLRYVNA